jgi:aminopeptidase N
MKEAMTNYFQKYQWTNTELSDFVGALKEAYDKQP